MNVLDPCPSCGGKVMRIGVLSPIDPWTGRARRYVMCCKCCFVSFTYTTRREAIEAWNRGEGSE